MSRDTCHVKRILEKDCKLSGWRINYDKSKLKICKNCHPKFRRMLRGILQVRAYMGKYLGIDISLMNKKGKFLQPVIDKMESKLSYRNYLDREIS